MTITTNSNGDAHPPTAAELEAIVVQTKSYIWCSICRRTIGEKPANVSMRSLLDTTIDHLETVEHRSNL